MGGAPYTPDTPPTNADADGGRDADTDGASVDVDASDVDASDAGPPPVY